MVGLGILAGMLSGTSCLLELDHTISCGDGFVDEDAGEECEPDDEKTYKNACQDKDGPQGEAACDPLRCVIIATTDQCAVCGDDEVHGDEECDRSDLAGQACPGGAGVLRCTDDCRFDYSDCESCGNGDVDPGEECDPMAPVSVTTLQQCEGLEPLTGRAYAGGQYRFCRDDCLWDRVGCNYCGNLQIDTELPVDLEGHTAPAEVCDGWLFDEAYIEEKLGASICYEVEELRPVVKCDVSCTDIQPANEDQLCCVRKDYPCPLPGSGRKCCFELENGSSAYPCEDRNIGGPTLEHVCR